jgi:menaquinone-dependent protoporphyrinogen oxidase
METNEADLWKVSRRDVLALSAGVIAAMTLAAVPGGAGAGHAAEIKFAEGRCEGRMKRNVLVTYASKYGSTGGVADAIAKELCARGVTADVARTKNAPNIGSYQAVVVGTAIYMGKWMAEAMDFVTENREALSRVPVAYFLVCMNLAEPTEKKLAEVATYTDPILKAVPEVKPFAVGTFAGAMDYNNVNWAMKMILKSKGGTEGDFRDWNAIRAWARDPLGAKIAPQ